MAALTVSPILAAAQGCLRLPGSINPGGSTNLRDVVPDAGTKSLLFISQAIETKSGVLPRPFAGGESPSFAMAAPLTQRASSIGVDARVTLMDARGKPEAGEASSATRVVRRVQPERRSGPTIAFVAERSWRYVTETMSGGR